MNQSVDRAETDKLSRESRNHRSCGGKKNARANVRQVDGDDVVFGV